jgi:hypothetical protein
MLRIRQLLLLVALLLATIPGQNVGANQYCLSDAMCGEQMGCYGTYIGQGCTYASASYCCNSTSASCCQVTTYQCSPGVYCSTQLSCPASLQCDSYMCLPCDIREW